MKRSILCVVVALLGIAGPAGATTSISTLPFQAGLDIQPFGEFDTATYGQTITVPAVDNALDGFSFWLNDVVNPDVVDFAGYVMAWDGAKATGSILWNSAPMSTTNNGGLNGYEQITFNTGGLALTSGAQYVLFVSASNYFDGSQGLSYMAGGATPYASGNFVFMNNGSDFSALTTYGWDQWVNVDAAFEAQFSPGGPTVPAPAAVLLSTLGAGLVGWLRRRGTV